MTIFMCWVQKCRVGLGFEKWTHIQLWPSPTRGLTQPMSICVSRWTHIQLWPNPTRELTQPVSVFVSSAGADETAVDPVYSLLKSAAGLPSAGRVSATSSSRSSPAPPPPPTAAVTEVQPAATSKNELHRSNSSSPHHSQSPHRRQQLQRKLLPVLHLPGMPVVQLHYTRCVHEQEPNADVNRVDVIHSNDTI